MEVLGKARSTLRTFRSTAGNELRSLTPDLRLSSATTVGFWMAANISRSNPPCGYGASRGTAEEFSASLAMACHGLEAVRNVMKRPGTVGSFPQVDGLARGSSAFGHGHAGRADQITG